MLTLIMGGSGSGKSAYAESYVVRQYAGDEKYYIATMQVYDREGQAKVEKHRRQRWGKGFVTIEQPVDIAQALNEIKSANACALLECMSNLTANEMFFGETPESAEAVAQKIVSEVLLLEKGLKELVVVTNNVFEDGVCYEEATMEYLRAMGRIHEKLAAAAEQVIEVVAGIPIVVKAGKESAYEGA